MSSSYAHPFSRSDRSLLANWFWTVDRPLLIAADGHWRHAQLRLQSGGDQCG